MEAEVDAVEDDTNDAEGEGDDEEDEEELRETEGEKGWCEEHEEELPCTACDRRKDLQTRVAMGRRRQAQGQFVDCKRHKIQHEVGRACPMCAKEGRGMAKTAPFRVCKKHGGVVRYQGDTCPVCAIEVDEDDADADGDSDADDSDSEDADDSVDEGNASSKGTGSKRSRRSGGSGGESQHKKQARATAAVCAESIKVGIKEVLKGLCKRKRRDMLGDSDSDSDSEDDDDSEGEAPQSRAKIFKDLSYEDTIQEMSAFVMPQEMSFEGLSAQQAFWAEQYNADRQEMVDIRAKLVQMMPKVREARKSSDVARMTRVNMRLKQAKQQWCKLETDIELNKHAIAEAKYDGVGAARVMQRVKEKRRGSKVLKTKNVWKSARKGEIQEAAKRHLLQSAVSLGSPGSFSGSSSMGSIAMPLTPQQQYVPWAPGGPFGGSPKGGGSKGSKGGGSGKGGGGKGGGKGRTHALDELQKSRCQWLKGPFAPDHERYDNSGVCQYCKDEGRVAHHAGSWECDICWWAPRARFQRGEVDKWNTLLVGGAAAQPPGPPPMPPPQP